MRQPGSIIIGIGLLLIAAWFVVSVTVPVNTPGMRLAGPAELWPVFLALIGLALLVQGSFQPDYPGVIFFGVVFLFVGAFLSIFSLRVGNLTWVSLLQYWPVLLIVVGVAFMVLYIAREMRDQGLVIMSNMFTWIGLTALLFTLGLVSRPAFLEILRYWPLLLLLIALMIAGSRQQAGSGNMPSGG